MHDDISNQAIFISFHASFFQNKTFQVTFFKNESQLEDFDASDAGGNLDFGIIFDEIPHEKVICIFYDSQPDLRFTDRATCIFKLESIYR